MFSDRNHCIMVLDNLVIPYNNNNNHLFLSATFSVIPQCW